MEGLGENTDLWVDVMGWQDCCRGTTVGLVKFVKSGGVESCLGVVSG